MRCFVMVRKNEKSKNVNSNKEKKQGGFKFGRNLGSFLIIIASLVLLFLLIAIPYSYISTASLNKAKVFEGQSIYTEYMEKYNAYKDKPNSTITYKPVRFTKANKFDAFDLRLECKEYIHDYRDDKGKVTFDLSVKWNEATTAMAEQNKLNPIPGSSYNTVNTAVALASDWVKFSGYSYERGLRVEYDKEAAIGTNYVITDVPKYPLFAKTWPIKVKVPTPTAYVFLSFSYSSNKGTINEAYVVEFSYNQYMTDSTVGAIPNK